MASTRKGFSMDRLLHLLKDHEVGIWCKRAAWILVALNFVHLLLLYFPIFFSDNTHSLSLRAIDWSSLLQTLLSFVSGSLFDFFILYAAGVAVEHITGSTQEEEDDDDDDEAISE
jgi:uncharacterized integral membrane protein